MKNLGVLALTCIAMLVSTAEAAPMSPYLKRKLQLAAVRSALYLEPQDAVVSIEQTSGANFAVRSTHCRFEATVTAIGNPGGHGPANFTATVGPCEELPVISGPPALAGGISSGGMPASMAALSLIKLDTILESEALARRVGVSDEINQITFKRVSGGNAVYEVVSNLCRVKVTLTTVVRPVDPNSPPAFSFPSYSVKIGNCL